MQLAGCGSGRFADLWCTAVFRGRIRDNLHSMVALVNDPPRWSRDFLISVIAKARIFPRKLSSRFRGKFRCTFFALAAHLRVRGGTKGLCIKRRVYYARRGDYSPDGCQLNTKTWPAFRARSASNNFSRRFFPISLLLLASPAQR